MVCHLLQGTGVVHDSLCRGDGFPGLPGGQDLAGLIGSLAEKISALTADSGETSLKEIRKILSSMEGNVSSISSTLSAIAEEA